MKYTRLSARSPAISFLLLVLTGVSACDNSADQRQLASQNSEQCLYLTIEEIYSLPADFGEEVICTTGTLARQDWRDTLAPADLAVSPITHPRVDINWQNMSDHTELPIVGELISVHGLLEVHEQCMMSEISSSSTSYYSNAILNDAETCIGPMLFYPDEFEIMVDLDPWEICEEVHLGNILVAPLQFEATLVCVSGIASPVTQPHELGAVGTISSFDESDPGYGPIQLIYHSGGPLIEERGPVRIAAFFDTWEECFLNGEPTPTPAPLSTLECKPTMELEIIEIEYLDQ